MQHWDPTYPRDPSIALTPNTMLGWMMIRTVPTNVDPSEKKRFAAIDGDADRLVYFYNDSTDGKVRLLDGDKITALYSKFIIDQLKVLIFL